MTDNLLTTAEVAKILGVTVGTIKSWRWMGKRKELPHCKLGGAIFYRREDVKSFADAYGAMRRDKKIKVL